ncbi:hypothetical protein H6P81_010711 [Aristolochia fimbriata]|uniref:Uncharacterized protein n=1 Tax=Aristolochia fimbriata TaxID=158543 RepID=A0AAV7ESB8_ARIFI|nr:hypothetical protein H6P81_010711 [Aristolochia fimbriata]
MKFSRKFIASLSQFYTNVSNCRDSPPRGRVRGRGHAQLVYSPETPTTESTIPIIDLSLLSSGSSSSSLNRRSQLLQDLDKACCQWGLFLVINHGVPEKQRNAMVKACLQISDPLEKERTAFVAAGNVENEPRPKNKACFINAAAPRERILFNKDYTQILTRVNFFEPPTKLPLSSFGEVSVDYCKSIKRLATALVRLISETECVQDGWYKKMLKKEPGNGGYHVLEANLYPPGEAESSETTTQFAVERPDQDQCHSSMGLLTVLMQNDVGGLEVLHNDKWVRVIQVPNSFVVIVGDHLEGGDGRWRGAEEEEEDLGVGGSRTEHVRVGG